jgi:hypothetical protein
MINFCCPVLNPTVVCSTVSSDGYEVTNLVSSDAEEARKGFLAYNAIRPPVTLTINFICSVDVSHIILWPQVGCQKSTGFEIYANSAPKPKPQNYQKAAFGYLEDDDQGIIFYRRVYYDECTKSTEHLKSFARKAVLGNVCSLTNTTSLQVKIIRTKSSVPALAKVEVWGKPGKSCGDAERRNVLKLWTDRIPKKVTVSSGNSERQLQTVSDTKFEVPENFLDSITCTIMAFPFILPCGKFVDQSTLDRHEQHEAMWGRAPSDPFTGRMFTENNRPIPATALKACIDRFLIEHSERPEVVCIPRTVGRKQKSNIHEMSCSTVPSADVKPCTSVGCPTTESKEVTCVAVSSDASHTRHKRPKYRSDNMARTKVHSTESHEEEINRSLNCALKSTLAGLPTYTRVNNHITMKQCAACSSDNMLFKLPCKHFLCRKCLVLKMESKDLCCSMCKACFQSGDILRYHV